MLYQLYLFNPIISVLNHLFYFNILYALYQSRSVSPIIVMIVDYITYSEYFIPFVLIDIINIIDVIALPCRTQCCNVPLTPLAFITYRGTSPKPTI